MPIELEYAPVHYDKSEIDPQSDELLPIAYVIHYLRDDDEPSRNDTWTLISIDDDILSQAIERFDPDSSGDFMVDYLNGIKGELRDSNRRGELLEDYARFFVNAVKISNIETVTLASAYDEQNLLEELEGELEEAVFSVQ